MGRAATTGLEPNRAEMLARAREEFLELCEQDHVGVVAYLRRCGAAGDEAEEAAQEAFLAAWIMHTDRPDRWSTIVNPAGWLRRVARNCWKRAPGLRSAWEVPTEELPERHPPTSDPGELAPLTVTVLKTLSNLEELERMVWAFHRDGFANVEIASLVEVSPQKVTDVLKKVRRALRRAVEPDGSVTR
jgi:RNA polymerase sigma factor (sigma-70 family)